MRLPPLETHHIEPKNGSGETLIPGEWGQRQQKAISSITHDLRGPLCAIMGYLELAGLQAGKTIPPKAVEYLSLAREAGQRMHQMVNDILDMFRFENGDVVLEKKRTRVTDVFQGVRKIFAVMADLKHLHLKFSLPEGESLTVWSDPRYLARVLDNLVANAIKYTADGGTVQVSARRTRNRTLFEVVDTGRGIAPEAHDQIFEWLQQVHSTDQSSGYGIGLAVAKFIIESHGGEIRVESVPGKGSRFFFWLPAEPIRLTRGPAGADPFSTVNHSRHQSTSV